MNSGLPTAPTRMSAWATSPGRSRVRRVADGDRGVLLQQHHRHGFAQNGAAAHHHRVLALYLYLVVLQHAHDALRASRSRRRLRPWPCGQSRGRSRRRHPCPGRWRRSRRARRSAPVPGVAAGCRGHPDWRSVRRSSPAAAPWSWWRAVRPPVSPCPRGGRRYPSFSRRWPRPGHRPPGSSPEWASCRRLWLSGAPPGPAEFGFGLACQCFTVQDQCGHARDLLQR